MERDKYECFRRSTKLRWDHTWDKLNLDGTNPNFLLSNDLADKFVIWLCIVSVNNASKAFDAYSVVSPFCHISLKLTNWVNQYDAIVDGDIKDVITIVVKDDPVSMFQLTFLGKNLINDPQETLCSSHSSLLCSNSPPCGF